MTSFSPSDWDRYAECYDALTKLVPYQDMLTEVCRTVNPIQTPLLDAGCGTGNVTQALLEHGMRTDDLVALDMSQNMLARARKKLPAVHFMHGDLNVTLPFAADTFRCVMCVNALYAVRNPKQTLKEYARILQPGGKLIVVTPRAGYENGLILKAHSGSTKSDEYWQELHASPAREQRLVHEAVEDSDTAKAFLELVLYNRHVAHTRVFHFFTPEMLVHNVRAAGFISIQTSMVYAKQNILLVAERS